MLEPAFGEDVLPGVLRLAVPYTNLSHDHRPSPLAAGEALAGLRATWAVSARAEVIRTVSLSDAIADSAQIF